MAPLTLLTLSLVVCGCFDVKKVQLPPFVVDDFDDEDDLRPRSDSFDSWRCHEVTSPVDGGAAGNADAGTPGVACVVERVGADHPRAMTMRFDLDDPADGERLLGGAVLATEARGATPVDLSAFKEIVLSAILDTGDPPLPAATQLRVEIGCTLLGRPMTVAKAVSGLAIGADWMTFRLSLAELSAAEPSCRSQVDALRISVRPGLADGQSTRSALHVDDIYLD